MLRAMRTAPSKHSHPKTPRTNSARIEPLETRIAPAAVASIDLSGLTGTDGFKLSGVSNYGGAGASVSRET